MVRSTCSWVLACIFIPSVYSFCSDGTHIQNKKPERRKMTEKRVTGQASHHLFIIRFYGQDASEHETPSVASFTSFFILCFAIFFFMFESECQNAFAQFFTRTLKLKNLKKKKVDDAHTLTTPPKQWPLLTMCFLFSFKTLKQVLSLKFRFNLVSSWKVNIYFLYAPGKSESYFLITFYISHWLP